MKNLIIIVEEISVRTVGVEPTWSFLRRLLKPVRLPIPPRPQISLFLKNLSLLENLLLVLQIATWELIYNFYF